MSRADLRSRVVHHKDGSMSLAPPGAASDTVELSAGRIVSRPAKPEPEIIGPRNSALTRAECAVLLGVDIEQAAKLLDEVEIPRLVAYDGPRVRALVQSRAQP